MGRAMLFTGHTEYLLTGVGSRRKSPALDGFETIHNILLAVTQQCSTAQYQPSWFELQSFVYNSVVTPWVQT